MSRIVCYLMGILFLAFQINAQAQETTEVTTTTTTSGPLMIVTPVPAPKEVVVIPQEGKKTCYQVEAGFVNNVWVPKHDVCQYNVSKAWVDSYWKCTSHVDTKCTGWDWVPGHYVDLY